MDALKSAFVSTTPLHTPSPIFSSSSKKNPTFLCSVSPDPWSLSDGNSDITKPKPKSKNPKNPLSHDNARRLINSKAKYLSELRRNQGSHALTPKWIKRTPEQMLQYLEDDRHGHLYGKHVVAAIKRVRSLSGKAEGSYDMRVVMSSFVAKLTSREMCVVLKEQKGWRQVRDFFAWMKLQLSYEPSVIIYTVVLRAYGQVGKIKLAEETFLEMLESGCEPDEVACGTMICAYARWGRHKAMLSLYSAIQERGITLPVAVYNFMLSSLQKARHGDVIELWNNMVRERILPNCFTYTVIICSFVKEGLSKDAFEIFRKMKNSGFMPEEATYSQLIGLITKDGILSEALTLYEEMRSIGLLPSNYTCASLLTLYYRNEEYSRAAALFLEMEKNKVLIDEVIYGLLIRIYGKLGLSEDAEKTFKDIEKLGLLNNEKTFLAMAQVHIQSKKFNKALEVIELMKSRNIFPSRFSVIVRLQCYVMMENLELAESTFESLLKTGPPDACSCTHMLNMYSRLGKNEKAKAFVTFMRQYKVVFDEELLKAVLKLYCLEGMVRDAEQLIEELGPSSVFQDSKFVQILFHTKHGRMFDGGDSVKELDQHGILAYVLILRLYLTDNDITKAEHSVKLLLNNANGLSIASQLICKFSKEGENLKAEHLYKLLIKLGCTPEHSASASMISLYGKLQKLKEAQEIFEFAIDSSEMSKKLYDSMVNAYAKNNEPETAFLVYKEASEKGYELGVVAVSLLVNTLINSGKYIAAESIIRKSLEDNFKLDTVAYNTFLKAMLEAGKLHYAASIYDHMVSSGVVPSIQTYCTMISVYGRGRNLDKAVEMFDMARSKGIPLDEKAYTNIICYYGKAGRVDEASFLFNRMLEEGIKPGKVSYNIMMNIYATKGLHCQAEELFEAMQKDGFSANSSTYLSLIRAYAEDQKHSEAEETIRSMQKRGISPTCSHFNLLLSSFTIVGKMKEAERVYEEIIGSGLRPDIACFRTMLRGYLEYGLIEEGILFFEDRVSMDVGLVDRFITSAAVHLYRVAGMGRKAEGILDSMGGSGLVFLENLQVGSKRKKVIVS